MKKLAAALMAVLFLAGCGDSAAPAATAAPIQAAAATPGAATTKPATPEPVATPDPTEEVTPEPEVTAEPEPTEEPTPPPPATVPRGQIARAGDWDVKVTGKVNFNAWKVVKAENMFNEPAPKGWSMVLVPLQVWNRGSEKAVLLGEMGYVVGDANGVEYADFDDPSCGVIPRELDAFKDIRPGGTLKGNMCFAVENADLKTLRMGWPADMFGDLPDVEFSLR